MSNEEILIIVKDIQNRLLKIERIIQEQQNSCIKMEEHINFVDNVFENIKKPFCSILSYYNNGNLIKMEKCENKLLLSD